MTAKAFAHIFAFICITANVVNALETVNGKIKITTGTASACGDTVRFINNQLAPTYEEYGEFLDIEFVPWGRTVMHGDGTFTCQFGVNDCWANRLHRCVLNRLQGNQAAQLEYMKCEFTTFSAYFDKSYFCSTTVGLNEEELEECTATSGDELDVAARDAAAEPMKIINFVPSIVINEDIDISIHNAARSNLRDLICNALALDETTGIKSTDC